MREWVRTCDLCGRRILESHFCDPVPLKVKTEVIKGEYEYDICHKCEFHMIRYILKARKKDTDDEA